MNAERLSTMSDRELVEKLEELLREERRLTAAVLVHMGEVEASRLYLPRACSSMFVNATRVLGMSEGQALKRIRAARAMRRFPAVAAAVEDGRLHRMSRRGSTGWPSKGNCFRHHLAGASRWFRNHRARSGE